MSEEAHRKTDFERFGAFGLQVVERTLGREVPAVGRRVPRAGRIGVETRESQTHRCVRRTQLDVGEVLGHVRNDFREHDRSADRRIEERGVHRVGTRQLRGPVVAARHGQVIRPLEAHLGREEDRLRLLAPADLLADGLRIGEVVDVEHVGDVIRLVDGVAVLVVTGLLSVGDRAADFRGVGTHVRDRSADVGLQTPVLAEGLVDIDHHVAVGLTVVGLGDAVETVGRSLGAQVVGRCVEFLGIVAVRVVHPDAARNREPVEDVVGQRGVDHVAVLAVLAQVAVADPVGVLHLIGIGSHRRPVLLVDAARGVVAFIHLHIRPVVAAREEVSRHQRVGVDALIDHVAVFLDNVAGTQIEVHLVLEERRGIAESEVVTVVTVVGNDTARIDGAGRSIGLAALVARRERNRLGAHDARLEIVVGRVVAPVIKRIQTFAPRVDAVGGSRQLIARAVTGLEHRHHERREHFGVARHRHGRLTGLAALGRDQNGAVGGIRTIECRGGCARQDGHRLDILRVEVGDGLRRALRIELLAAVAAEVAHRNAVDHIEGVRRLLDGFRTAHHDLRRTADTRRRGVDIQTGHLAVERIDEIDVFHGHDVLGVDLLGIIRERLLRALDAEGRHDDRFDLRCGLAQRNVERSAVADGNRLRLIAQIAHFEPCRRRCGHRKGETAVGVGRRTGRGVADDDRGADDRLAAPVADITCDGRRLLGFLYGEDDAQRTDVVGQVRTRHHPVQGFRKRHRRNIEACDTVGLDIRTRNEQIFGLPFDLGHDL